MPMVEKELEPASDVANHLKHDSATRWKSLHSPMPSPSREQLHHMRFGLSTTRGSNAESHAPVDDKTTQVS